MEQSGFLRSTAGKPKNKMEHLYTLQDSPINSDVSFNMYIPIPYQIYCIAWQGKTSRIWQFATNLLKIHPPLACSKGNWV